jgi:hypothetical protein
MASVTDATIRSSPRRGLVTGAGCTGPKLAYPNAAIVSIDPVNSGGLDTRLDLCGGLGSETTQASPARRSH